jgi:hypothetical protein
MHNIVSGNCQMAWEAERSSQFPSFDNHKRRAREVFAQSGAGQKIKQLIVS